MNIFEQHTGFTGCFGSNSTGGTLLSLLAQAAEIRQKLGVRGYLLDNYLSMFLEAANTMLTSEVAEEGFSRSNDLRKLCFSVLDGSEKEKGHPLYNRAVNTHLEKLDMMQYQERQTKMNLFYTLLFDEFLPLAVNQYLEEAKNEISNAYDQPTFLSLYRDIVEEVGEPLMESLNLRLKQRFLVAPLASVFVQGLNNDLLYTLTTRDRETSRQVFQLLLDHS